MTITNLQTDGGFGRESQMPIALTSRHSNSWAHNRTVNNVSIQCIVTDSRMDLP
jgi:hypothetical protein